MPTKTKKIEKKMTGKRIPSMKIRTRVRDNRIKNKENPYKWKTLNTNSLFKNKKIVVFSLPGAFTPTCSSKHLPDYERHYNELKKLGVDEVYCVSVNDAFVMNNWAKKLKIKNVKMLPDGNGQFTRKMSAMVPKNNLGFGERSWRYSMYVENGKIQKVFEEPGMRPNCPSDPFTCSDVFNMIKYLKQ
jgi:peroxiredoxin